MDFQRLCSFCQVCPPPSAQGCMMKRATGVIIFFQRASLGLGWSGGRGTVFTVGPKFCGANYAQAAALYIRNDQMLCCCIEDTALLAICSCHLQCLSLKCTRITLPDEYSATDCSGCRLKPSRAVKLKILRIIVWRNVPTAEQYSNHSPHIFTSVHHGCHRVLKGFACRFPSGIARS